VFRGRPQAFQRDLERSLAALRESFGISEPPFAYPFGIYDWQLGKAARAAGVSCGLTTEKALVTPGSDPFFWGRLNVEPYDTAASLAAKLAGWHELVRTFGRMPRAWLNSRGVPEAGTAARRDIASQPENLERCDWEARADR
jgi:hypothetical protein